MLNPTEQAIIGATIRGGTKALHDVVDTLPGGEYFTDREAGFIWDAVLYLYRKNEPIDVASVALTATKIDSKFHGSKIVRIVEDTPTVVNLGFLATETRAAWALKEVGNTFGDISTRAKGGNVEIGELLGQAEEAIQRVSGYAKNDDPVLISDAIKDEATPFLNDTPPAKGSYFPTRIEALNAKIGGFFKGDVTVIGGEPSQGKTSIALDAAIYTSQQDNKVLIISLDETRSAVISKYLANQAGISANRFRTVDPPGTDQEKELVRSAIEGCEAHPHIWIAEKTSLSIQEVHSIIRRWTYQHQIGMVIIDYIQQIRSDGNEADHLRVQGISRMLKAVAKECDVSVVALSQLSKKQASNASKTFEMANIKRPDRDRLLGSSAINQDANLIIMPWRPVAYIDEAMTDSDPAKEKHMSKWQWVTGGEKAEIMVVKNKTGAVGNVPVKYFPLRTRYENVEDGDITKFDQAKGF